MSVTTKPASNVNVLVTLLHPYNGFRLFEGYWDRQKQLWVTAIGEFSDANVTGWLALSTANAQTFTH